VTGLEPSFGGGGGGGFDVLTSLWVEAMVVESQSLPGCPQAHRGQAQDQGGQVHRGSGSSRHQAQAQRVGRALQGCRSAPQSRCCCPPPPPPPLPLAVPPPALAVPPPALPRHRLPRHRLRPELSSCRPSSLLGSANKTLHYITLHYITLHYNTLPPASADSVCQLGPGDCRCHLNLQQNPVEDDDDDDTEDGDDDDVDDDDGDDDDVDDEDDVDDYLHPLDQSWVA
jgi:hypothetical protein